jgi:spore maturation protein CgeB
MKVVIFCHSLLSDWNHGNAHFLRGVVTELRERGHDVAVYEPYGAWSVLNLIADVGELPLLELRKAYPGLASHRYELAALDLEQALDGAELVLVHEWNDPALVDAIGRHRLRGGQYTLLFHDTHHRAVSDASALSGLDLSGYDGILAFGEAVRERYLKAGWSRRVFTWHEAADVRVFRPLQAPPVRDLVWVGNWGDDERARELREYLFEPVRALGLSATVFGVRYPAEALAELCDAGSAYGGFLPNYEVPRVFAESRVTVHVPRRPYVLALPGIPTIRVFEALACGIPLISAPWHDVEGLFREGDYLKADSGARMQELLVRVLSDRELRETLIANGRETILARHTCAHRVSELFSIVERLRIINPAERVQVA